MPILTGPEPMHIDPAGRTRPELYKLVTGTVVPRPIAWVTTRNAEGLVNLAPFSAFTFVSCEPPIILFCAGPKGESKNGEVKDTVRNVLRKKAFVVNIADQTMLEPLHRSAFEYPGDVSEVEELRLDTAPGLRVDIPRIAAAPVSLECHLIDLREYGHEKARLIVGEVVMFHIRDDLLKDGKIDTRALNPIARLAGPNYATLGDIIHRDRLDLLTGI